MSSQDLIFRAATFDDSATVAALHTLSWRSAYRGMLPDSYLDAAIDDERAQHWRARLTPPASPRQYVLLAEQERALVGFACVLLDEEPAWGACLDNLHIRPERRGGGVGRQLFARAARWTTRAAPGQPLYLWVFAANLPARQFYDRLGGQVVERATKPMPGGAAPPVLRYLWPDLARLLAALSA